MVKMGTALEEYIFAYDTDMKEVILNCSLKPTEVTKQSTPWLYAHNNKYGNEDDIDPEKVGKWMLFLSKTTVDSVWEKIKNAITQGHLWQSKVSTSDTTSPTYAIIIYTKDYTDLQDVVNVLDYLESSGIKPPNIIIRYKTDQQTRAGVYYGGKHKASIYASNTIRNHLK